MRNYPKKKSVIVYCLIMSMVLFVFLMSGCSGSKLAANNQSSNVNSSQPAATGSQNYKTYESQTYGFKIQYPEDWASKEDEGDINFCSPREGPEDDFLENVNVGVEDLSQNPVTLDEYKEAGISILQGEGYTFEGSSSATLDGEPAVQVIFTKTDENINIKIMQIYAIKNQNCFVITYGTTPDKYSDYLATAQEMIDSFKF